MDKIVTEGKELGTYLYLLTGGEPPISLKEGLRMTLPGIYAEMSAKQGGKLLEIRYPWDNE